MRPEEINELNYSRGLGIFGRPVAYYPNLGKALKSKAAAIIVCQFIYWEGKQAGKSGSFEKTYLELMEETGLTESEIDTARKVLATLKIAKAKAKGNPAKLHWEIDFGQLDKILHDWYLLTQGPGAVFKETATRAAKPAKDPKTIPPAIYSEAVKVYFEFCEKPEIMGGKPLFGAAQGKALKDILKYLKTQSKTEDWPGALATLEFLFLSWPALETFYAKQIDILNIRKNINNIISSLTNGNGKQKTSANRVNYANAANGY